MVNCSEEKKEYKCAKELEPVSAKQACEERREKSTNLLAEALKMANPLNWLVDALTSSAKSDQQVLNNIRIQLKSTSVLEQMSKCENTSSSVQSNIIRGPSVDCINAWAAMGLSSEELKNAGTLTNITQENINKSIMDCKINQIMDALSTMDASIDNSVVQDALNKAQGLMSDSTSDQFICNNISSEMTACKYLSQNQCCNNNLNSVQTNLIDKNCTLGPWSNITQKNDSTQLAACGLSVESGIKEVMATKIKNKANQSAKNSSEGMTMGFLIILFVIIAMVLGAPVVLIGSVGNKLFSILGIILLVVGSVTIALYWVNKKAEKIIVDKPLSGCDETSLYDTKLERTTYGKAKLSYEQNSDIAGFDFYIDSNEDISPLKIDSKQTGSVLYFSSVGKYSNCEDVKYEELVDKNKTISYIKAKQDVKYLIIGGAVLMAGIVQLLIGFFKKDSKSGSSSSESSSSE
jgi:hypothetical protein